MAKNDKRTITREEALGWNADPLIPALEREGITPIYWAKKLKAELGAKERKVFHNKDILSRVDRCPKCDGEGNLATSVWQGEKITSKRCSVCKGLGVIEISPVVYSKPMIAWDVRQKARQDLARYMGFEPAQRHELSGKGGGPVSVDLRPVLKDLTIDELKILKRIADRAAATGDS